MTVAFRVDPSPAKEFLAGLFRNQIPFATSLALNQTAKDAQDAIKTRLRNVFTIRRAWVAQGITIPKFSDKNDSPMSVTIQLDPERSFLAKFEGGGTKYGTDEQPIAIPSTAIRPAFVDLPPLALYPKNLGLVARQDVAGKTAVRGKITKRGVLEIQGKRRTFVLTTDMFGVNVPGVYQRTGPGKHDFQLLWAYKPQIPIPQELSFVETAKETVDAQWGPRFNAAFDRAVKTAK